jgi:hypothetical protein
MWNSAGLSVTPPMVEKSSLGAAASSEPGEGADDGDPGVEPMAGDMVKPMDVTVDDSLLTVTPDPGLLADTEAQHFPLHIDPLVTWGEAERTLLRSDGHESYGWGNGDDNLGKVVGRCGTWGGYYCGPGYTQRLFDVSCSWGGERAAGAS